LDILFVLYFISISFQHKSGSLLARVRRQVTVTPDAMITI